MSSRRNLYVGRAGQMAVMAELLMRGWNVALPEVDVGDDVFVVHDEEADFSRVQVKTATARPLKRGCSAQFQIDLRQLRAARTPELVFIFVIRREERWEGFVVMRQSELREEQELHGVGSVHRDSVMVRLTLRDGGVFAGRRDLSRFLNDFSRWPVLWS